MLQPVARLQSGRMLYRFRGVTSNMYLLTDGKSDSTFLVDCGMPEDAAGLIHALKAFPPLKRVICTHFHVDHISGWPILKRHYTSCDIWFHEKAAPFVDGRSAVPMPGIKAIRNILLPVMREYRYLPKPQDVFKGALYGTPFKKGFPAGRVQFFNARREPLPGFLTLETPGHRPEEVSFLDSSSGCFISGDFILVMQNRIRVNTFVSDPQAQANSIRSMGRFSGMNTICPGHGPCRDFSLTDIQQQ
ncbi:MAG: MBL fold metallo-hydrolase [Deltaproteobacteria bacterium]